MSIKGVIHETREADHEDNRRSLFTAFNGDINGFEAKQVKFLVVKEDTEMGGHYHNYSELFYLLEGEGTFTLKDLETQEIEKYKMVKGSRILIPPKVAHKVNIKKDSILVGCTEEPYKSPEHNDNKIEF